jgi:hypothetical protein
LIRKLSHNKFTAELIRAYKNRGILSKFAPLPLIVGAGISATSGIPLDHALRTSVCNAIGVDGAASYASIYEFLQNETGERHSPLFKPHLRNLLHAAGIPRVVNRPAPNLANLAVIHLLRSSVFGPVISLNVDPLLQVADRYFEENAALGVQFIGNVSQFSELGAVAAPASPLVLQIHGSIEEPLSLRFLDDELAPKESVIVRPVVNCMARAGAVCCVGASLNDDVIERMLAAWAQRVAGDHAKLRLFFTFYQHAPQDRIRLIHDSIAKRLEPFGTPLELFYTDGFAADDFFRDVVTLSRIETKVMRGDGNAAYYVPVMTDNVIRAELFLLISERNRRSDQDYATLPDDSQQLALDIILHCVQARGPFSLLDIARSSRRFRDLSITAANAEGRLVLAETIENLCIRGVIAFVENTPQGWKFKSQPSARASIGDMRRLHFARHPDAHDAAVFVSRCLEVLSVHVADAGARRRVVKRLAALVIELEREREPEFVPNQAVPAAAYFDAPELVRSHRDLDERLDRLKGRFRRLAADGEIISCTVVTEVGEHLFRPEALEKLNGNPSHEDVAGCLRDWIRDVFVTPRQARIKIFLAKRDLPWNELFGADKREATRAALESKVAALIELLRSSPNISIAYVDFARHNDHMWYFVVDGAQATESQGIYYPTNFDERAYYGVEVRGSANMQKLRAIETNLRLHADPEERTSASHVIGLTILDASQSASSDDTPMLVCVRDPSANGDHGDVASVPTKRIARSIFDAIAGQVTWQMGRQGVKLCDVDSVNDNDRFTQFPARSGECVLRDAVCDLLSRKFNLGDALEKKQIAFRAKPMVVRTGESPKINAGDSGEYISILNVLVLLDAGAHLIPTKTASYNDIRWVKVSEFRSALADETPITFPSGAARQYGGLCVCSSDLLLHLQHGPNP